MNLYNNFDKDAVTCFGYWNRNGAKFQGNDDELREKYTGCGHQMPFMDEEGCFNEFLCCIDYTKCDKNCTQHHPELNEDVAEFVESLNRSLGK